MIDSSAQFQAPSSPSSLGAPNRAGAASHFLSIITNRNQLLQEIHTPKVSNLTFQAMDIAFKARHIHEGDVAHLLIWGSLGHLPYTVDSAAKRRNMISILESTHGLKHVHFGVDPQMKIIVTGEYKIEKPLNPDYLFIPLIRFLEEARPFINLIGEYL